MSVAVLNQRYERVIELNREHGYIYNEKKSEQYLRVLLEIKKRKYAIWAERRANDKNYAQMLETAKQNVIYKISTGQC